MYKGNMERLHCINGELVLNKKCYFTAIYVTPELQNIRKMHNHSRIIEKISLVSSKQKMFLVKATLQTIQT